MLNTNYLQQNYGLAGRGNERKYQKESNCYRIYGFGSGPGDQVRMGGLAPVGNVLGLAATPVGVGAVWGMWTHGSSCVATMGWRLESLWDLGNGQSLLTGVLPEAKNRKRLFLGVANSRANPPLLTLLRPRTGALRGSHSSGGAPPSWPSPSRSIRMSRGSAPLLGPTMPRFSSSSMMRAARP